MVEGDRNGGDDRLGLARHSLTSGSQKNGEGERQRGTKKTTTIEIGSRDQSLGEAELCIV